MCSAFLGRRPKVSFRQQNRCNIFNTAIDDTFLHQIEMFHYTFEVTDIVISVLTIIFIIQ